MPKPYNIIKLDDGYAEGYVQVNGRELYWKSFGKPKKGTVLVLHGGPGSSHNNVISFAKFSDFGYRIVFYDQLGGGASEKPGDISLYTMDRFVEDVEGVRKNLNLGKVHLYGASWGGFLAPGYAVKYWQNLKSLMVQSGTCSMPLLASEINRMRSKLPKKIQATLKKYEEIGDYKNPEYDAAMKYVYGKHAWRFDPLKHPQTRLWLKKGAGEYPYSVYRIMMGINDFYGTGNLWHWDVTNQLKNIRVPTLITCGRYDEVTPKNSEVLHKEIKGSNLIIFEKSAHHMSIEEPEKWLNVHREFLDGVSAKS